ncbi:fimbria/pilus outer membrane usher protein [Sphingomonas parva]|uniref:fimbria/pilus outer membrane usher protein n=1 Tax=Sphingomonas parva TaxID=2555898 RepID=UPI0014305B48|nr:fimbria/pilus outer membrane usher protein [Sphingomonas parva]
MSPARNSLCLAAAVLLALMGVPAAAAEPAAGLRPALLDVSVNGQRSREPAMLLEDGQGGLYATAATLRLWRLRPPAGPPVAWEGESWYRLDTIQALRLRLSAEDQSLAIEVAAEGFELQSSALAPAAPMAMTPAAAGGFLNYDLLVEHARGDTSLNGAFEAGMAVRRGVLTTTFVGTIGDAGKKLVRLESGWTLDRPRTLTTLRIGDSISSSGPGSVPVRFGGVQYGRNFTVQPGYLTMPLPTYGGSATLPGVVDIYVNNVLQATREVGPGPFQLTDVPVQSGGGKVQIVTRDLLGRETVSEQSYYASSILLRRGLHDFSWEAGLVRRAFGLSSNDYGTPMASTTHRYGLTDGITLEGHLQASRRTQMAGVGATFALGNLGVAGGAASFSHSERGNGVRLAGSFERRTSGLSLGVRAESSSRNYAFIGLPDGEPLPRRTVQAFADVPFARGAAGLNIIARDFRGQPDERLAGLFVNHRLGKSASLQFYARRAIAGERQTVIGLHAAFLFGGRRSASAGMEAKGGTSLRLSYQKDPPAGEGTGYRIAATAGALDGLDAVVTRNLRSAALTAQVSHAHGRTGVRAAASGSIGFAGKRVFASRTIGSSFAAVKVGDFQGVKVYADNQLVAVTDASGTAIIPALRPFERNVIRIDESDLPLDVTLASNELAVRPFAKAATLVRFAAERSGGVLMRVLLEDGRPLPPGAQVLAEGSDRVHVSAGNGQVYVDGLGGPTRLTASWPGGRCSFVAARPSGDDAQPRLENLICSKGGVYAAK